MRAQIAQIADYYDQTLPFYNFFWHKNSHGIHYGLWDEHTKNLQDALFNQNRFMADVLKIKSGDYILDAGCGVGGSSIWLAQNYNIKAAGITLSQRQLKKARQLAEKYGLSDRLSFEVQDYLHTNFPESSFGIVWGEESVCYAEDKRDFLKEAYRVLKPGGRLIVADGFLKRKIDPSEKDLYEDLMVGMALPNLSEMKQFEQLMHEVGFKEIKVWDKTNAAKPSSKIMHRKMLILCPFAIVLYKLGFISSVLFMNIRAGLAQYKLVKSEAAGYGVFYGEK